jgi:hypothetical protein
MRRVRRSVPAVLRKTTANLSPSGENRGRSLIVILDGDVEIVDDRISLETSSRVGGVVDSAVIARREVSGTSGSD